MWLDIKRKQSKSVFKQVKKNQKKNLVRPSNK